MDKKIFGARMKARRIELNLTLEDIAKKLGLAKSTVQRYESGTIQSLKLPVIEALARELGVTPAWLCGKTDDLGAPADVYGTPLNRSLELNQADISFILKDERKRCNLSVDSVCEQLKQKGITISEKTLYGYENGVSKPKLETFLALCDIYGIRSIISALGFSYSVPEGSTIPLEDIELRESLLNSFELLNTEGRKKLVGYAEDLLGNGKYDKKFADRTDSEDFTPASAG